MRAIVACAGVALVSSFVTRAPAQSSCSAGARPWVSVRIATQVPSRAQILAQLRAGLEARGIAVCEAKDAPARPAIATIELLPPEGERVSIVVSVADRVTDKRVSREIDLELLPRDAWPLSLALAADEVLRASWAELALTTAPPAKIPVPREVETVVRDSILEKPAALRAPNVAFGAAFAGDLYAAGQRQLGVDARAAVWFTERFFAHAGIGLRSADTVDSSHGTVRSNAFVAELGPGLSLTDPAARFGLEALARAELTAVRYSADADAGSEGRDRRGIALYAKAGVAGIATPDTGLRLTLEITGGVPIRAVTARDAGSNATGIDGLALSAALGLAGVL